ncbi:NAD(P)/FAD-dependent oxidoreductase [Marinivivus vitaminiproducens]|uniref:NAD(P)/FAD-dependent oxidoreductase n=1 Tax=Marinivivus vitaminiproducens TaxID=3035935 RepID=UPI0027A85410|nr:FAD-binding oxidoreductase [Geminicoccaceae bacterium SCSIO 64248]
MKIVVIGAGVIGSAVAFRLAQAGAEVTIVEANRVGGGTSGISFAWTNAHDKPPRPYHEMNVAGMLAHAALRAEFGDAPWFHPAGCIEWHLCAEAIAEQAEQVDQLRDWGYRTEPLTAARLAELEPDVDVGRIGDAPIVHYPDEGWLDPVLYANAMVKAAQSLGAVLICGARVSQIETKGDRATGVHIDDGAVIAADVVVNCAGRWADRIGEGTDMRLPLAPTVGFLVFTPPVATSVARVLRGAGTMVRPDGAGRLMTRRNDVDDLVSLDMEPSPAMPQALQVMDAVATMIPGLKGVKPEAVRITARPIPADGLSAVGPMPRLANCYAVVTHSGVTLSPFLAHAVADEIVRGKDRAELADFRPARFFN